MNQKEIKIIKVDEVCAIIKSSNSITFIPGGAMMQLQIDTYKFNINDFQGSNSLEGLSEPY
jgi:Na+-transporting NADH:ubiquinone oxidoreductase subunit NqrF